MKATRVLFFILLSTAQLMGQLKEVAVPQYYQQRLSEQSNGRSFSTLAELDTIALPFWDDFSFSGQSVDSSLWQNGVGVFINPAIGITQPTINVATFDGINAKGRPYDPDSKFVTKTDSLLSHAIDLSTVPVAKSNSVYLSFFWQMKGLGELPDPKDSLRVDFLNSNGQWIRQWSVVGELENKQDDFQQVYLQVSGSEYFHEGFRFRFQSFGNTTGAFDSWHVDYIYLNQDRSTTNESIFDHAIATEPLSLFNTYTLIPYSQLFAFPDTIFSSVEVAIRSFENDIQPVEYTYIIRDEIAEQDIFVSDSTTFPLTNFGRDTIRTKAIDNTIFNASTDSLHITAEFQFNSGDNYLVKSINNGGADTTYLVDEFYNYRVNDTIRKEYIIHDILAYDDGSAEFAAGISESNGEIAVQFVLAESDSVTAIDIHFPQIKPLVVEGETMDLAVYTDLSGETGTILARQNFPIGVADSINQFKRFTFEIPVVVPDTFYIAFRQFKDEFIGIGLDKNNDQGDKIWSKSRGQWFPNLDVKGSLMMRPIFGKTDFDPNMILGTESEIHAQTVNFYPNPAKDVVNIKGQFDTIELLSISGNKIQVSISNSQINTTGLADGLYLIKTRYKNTIQTSKLIIQR